MKTLAELNFKGCAKNRIVCSYIYQPSPELELHIC